MIGPFNQGDFQLQPGTTPEVLQRKREMIAGMVRGQRTPQYTGEGIAQLMSGALGGYLGKQLLDEERALNEKTRLDGMADTQMGSDAFNDFFGLGGGGGGGYGGVGAYDPVYGGGGMDAMYPAALEPQITGPLTPFDALVAAGGPTRQAGAMLDQFGAPDPAAVNAALRQGGGPTNAAAAAMNAQPPATVFPRWF